MEKVRVGLVGVGGISQIIRIPAIKKLENANLVALCDIDEAKVGFIADKFDVKHVYYDIQNLLNSEKIDCLIICTPNYLHYPMALAALEKGIPVLVEKPVALNTEQTERLLKKSKHSKTPLVIGMNNRFREDAAILKDFIEKDELGKPFYLKCGWQRHWARQQNQHQAWLLDVRLSGGGVMMDMGISLVDLALWLLNKPAINQVRAFTYNIFSESKAEDSALAVIETEHGTVVTIEVSWRLHIEKDINYMHVFGHHGAAFLNPLRINKEMHGKLVNVTPMDSEQVADPFKSAFEKEISHFIDLVQGKVEPVTTIEDGLYIMRIMDAIYESARQGKEIDLRAEK